MASEKQIAANRRNAQLSTGPKTPAGIDIAKRNSLRHGLAGVGMVTPEYFAREADARADQITSSLKPWNAFEMWLVESIARDELRVEDAVRRQDMRRCEIAWRSQTHWDHDRQADAAVLADAISRKPLAVSRQLQESKHGCELMIEHWKMLELTLANKGGWSDDQRSYALDLLGVPAKLRDGSTPLDPAEGVEPLDHLKALAVGEIGRLTDLAGALREFDAQRRYGVEVGVADHDPTVKLMRRYEHECARRIAMYKGMFGQTRPGEHYEKRAKWNEGHTKRQDDEEAVREARERIAAGHREVLPDPEPAEPIVTCIPDPCPELLDCVSFEEEVLQQSESAPEADDLRSTG